MLRYLILPALLLTLAAQAANALAQGKGKDLAACVENATQTINDTALLEQAIKACEAGAQLPETPGFITTKPDPETLLLLNDD